MPSNFGKYEVIEKIAQGSMGEIFKVKSPDGEIFALKAVRKQENSSDDSENEQRFKRENALFRQIKHENVVRVHESYLNEDPAFMVMEYIEGGSIDDLLDGTPLNPKTVLKIALDVSAALYETEKIGIVHRDIKPGNILIDGDTYKLTDLGLARYQQVVYEEGLTLSQTALGTPHYISPEQVLHARAVDIRSDIYSLGATLFHCLTGERVHEGGSHMQIMMKQVHDPVKNPCDLNPNTPPGLSRAIMRMLEKDPDDRFQNTYELIEALKSIAAEDAGGELEDPQAIKPKNMAGMVMFICFVFLIVFASGAFIRMACLPPIEDDPYYQNNRKSFKPLEIVNSENLKVRATQIAEYLEKYPRDLEFAKIRRAQELAQMFAVEKEYQVTVEEVGSLREAREFELCILIDEQEFKMPSKQSRKVFYPNERIKFLWSVESTVNIKLEEESWFGGIVFEKTFTAENGLKNLFGNQTFELPDEAQEYFEHGTLSIKFNSQDLTGEDWQIFSDYIFPGDKW